VAPPPQRRQRRARWWPWLLLLLLLLLGGYFAWPWLFPKEEPPPPPEPVAEAKPSGPAAKPKPKLKPKPVEPPKPLVPESQRTVLLKAIQQRAAELKTCERFPGSPSRLMTKIGVSQPGPVKSVSFAGDAGPKALGDCVRKKVLGWNFADVKLASDVEILVSFSLDGAPASPAP
jgi:hypothetical protein